MHGKLIIFISSSVYFRARDLCESRGSQPGLFIPDSPYGHCGHDQHWTCSISAVHYWLWGFLSCFSNHSSNDKLMCLSPSVLLSVFSGHFCTWSWQGSCGPFPAFGEVFASIGVREPQPAASEAFTIFGEAHRSMEKFAIRMLKTLKPMISDLNTFLHKAVPDTRLTIKKYLDAKFEYLVGAFMYTQWQK